MGTKITKSNVRSAIRDDKAHMDYLKRDVRDDQRAGGKYKDINQTADEKHISKLAGDVKADGHFLSKHWNHSSPLNVLEVEKGGGVDWVKAGQDQTALEQSYMDEIPDGRLSPSANEGVEKEEEKEIVVNDSPEDMITKEGGVAPVTTEEEKVEPVGNKITPLYSVEVVSGEVDGVAYGAADVDGHIAVDTSTVGYDDTMNLP